MGTSLWQAAKAGWLVSLKCERTREGLKSARACPLPIVLHLPTLIAAFGPDLEVEQLQGRIRCPRCGSERYTLRTAVPPQPGAGVADAEPKARQMSVAKRMDTLGSTPEPWIVVTCARCNRRGQYKRETLLAVFPADTQMPSLLAPIAAWRGCGLAKAYLAMDAHERAKVLRDCGISYDVEMG